MKYAVSHSATLVAPPTRIVNLPLVDIGSQPLPGPTLQFSIDLDKGSRDLELIRDVNNFSAWKKPQTSQVSYITSLRDHVISLHCSDVLERGYCLSLTLVVLP